VVPQVTAAQALTDAYASGLFLGGIAGLCLGLVIGAALFHSKK
jgi:hypothetical protein